MLDSLRTGSVLSFELHSCVTSNERVVNGESVRMRKEVVVPLLKVSAHKDSLILWEIIN
jgi:hypothetical protein